MCIQFITFFRIEFFTKIVIYLFVYVWYIYFIAVSCCFVALCVYFFRCFVLFFLCFSFSLSDVFIVVCFWIRLLWMNDVDDNTKLDTLVSQIIIPLKLHIRRYHLFIFFLIFNSNNDFLCWDFSFYFCSCSPFYYDYYYCYYHHQEYETNAI